MVRYKIVFIIILGSFVYSPGFFAQELKDLTSKDFYLWYDINIRNFSPNGEWLEIVKDYEVGRDTIEVRAIHSKAKFIFTNISKSTLEDDWYVFVRKDMVTALNLKSGNSLDFPNFKNYDFIPEKGLLILDSESEPGNLNIYNLYSRKEETISQVEEYKVSPDKKKLVTVRNINGQQNALIYNLNNLKNPKLIKRAASDLKFDNLIWSPDSRRLGFYIDTSTDSNNPKRQIAYYNLDNGKFKIFNPVDWSEFPSSYAISRSYPYKNFMFSKSGETLFFSVERKNKREVSWDTIVEIWHSMDALDYLSLEVRNNFLNYPEYHFWTPEKLDYGNITSKDWPDSFFNGTQTHAFLFSSKAYHPNLKIENDIDIALYDFKNDDTLKNIKQLENKSLNIEVSPKGKYFHYFKDLQWYLVDLRSGKEINLSKLFQYPLYDLEYSYSSPPPAYGIPGYNIDETEIIIYDQFDIWVVNIETLKKRRITRGREKEITYRIVRGQNTSLNDPKYRLHLAETLNLRKPLILSAEDNDMNSGYFYLKNSKLQKITYKDASLDNIKISSGGLLFTEESQGFPPRIMYWNDTMRSPQLIYQSNPQHFNYKWGKAKLLSNKNEKGERIKGALFYPFNFEPGRKYPMVVKIYDQLSNHIYKYSRPSYKEGDGINISLLRSEGYFVLLPDLNYKLNDPGVSANNSLNRILNKALEIEEIDKNKVGLTGYSFGGYETNYIVAKNDRFAAAVSGAGFVDLIRRYTTLHGSGKPNFYQFENYQTRFTGPFYKLKEAYLRNSPIMHVENIETPLLIFSGKKDYHVNWDESIALYLALKRLKKEAVLLLYPEEAHVFLDPEKKDDLSRRIMDWFDHYLKEKPKKKWMIENKFDFN